MSLIALVAVNALPSLNPPRKLKTQTKTAFAVSPFPARQLVVTASPFGRCLLGNLELRRFRSKTESFAALTFCIHEPQM
jgi:hypothetical protein